VAVPYFAPRRVSLFACLLLLCTQAQAAETQTNEINDQPLLLADGCVGNCLDDGPARRAAPPRRASRATPATPSMPAPTAPVQGAAPAGGAVPGAAVTSASAQDEADYRTAIEQARAGNGAQALPTLKRLSEANPARADMLGDYVVVLGWTGNDAAALALAERIDAATAPAYVLEGLAGSARRQKQGALAEALYTQAAQRFPQRVQPRVGLVYTALDAGQLEQATQRVDALKREHPRDRDVLLAQGEVAGARNDWFTALSAYQGVLDAAPQDREALHGKARALTRLGTPQLAVEVARANPAAFTPEQVAQFRADATAHQIRWGVAAADQGFGPERFAELDRALAQSESVVPRALDRSATLTEAERRLALDRITALQARVRMRDTIELYEAMAARPDPLPPYVKAAAASAYLYLRQPERSRDLYREVVAADPGNTGAQLGLFYALAECEEHKAALEQIEKLAAATPETVNAYSAQTARANPEYIPVQIARAMAPLLANNPGEANERLRDLHARAPSNSAVTTSYASTMRARGWPRRAEQELRGVLATEPRDSAALGERAGALLEMRDYPASEAELAAGRAAALEDLRVMRAGRLWEVHNMNELIIESAWGRSTSGGPAGNRDFEIDARLYSKPFNYNYRAFGHLYSGQGTYDTGTGRYDRAGVGLEYRSPRYIISGELAHDINRQRPAATASFTYTPDDFWSLQAFAEADTLETPMQARLAGVTAWRAGGLATWRAHESRAISGGYQRLRFSDGNERDVVQARWTERVIAGPIYKMEITGMAAASRNSNTNAAYFNPRRDHEIGVEVANEWLQWRRYERAFRHRFVVSAANYHQENFGSGPAWGARYEQEWSADDRLVLRYGIGRTVHPYDGVRTARNFAYVSVNWRF